MKRSIKILLIALAATMVMSFGISAIILVVSGNFNVATETINDSKTFEPSEISSIEVDLASDDLNIIPTPIPVMIPARRALRVLSWTGRDTWITAIAAEKITIPTML